MKIIFVLVVIGMFSLLASTVTPMSTYAPTIALAETKVASTALVSSLTIKQRITYYSKLQGVSSVVVDSVIRCESNYNPNAVGDHGYSYGLVQIHLPSHLDITKAQAFDPDFAINYLASQIKQGNGKLWTCYRKYY